MYTIQPEAIRPGDEVTFLEFGGYHSAFIAESAPQEGKLYVPPPKTAPELGYKVVYLSQIKTVRRPYAPGDWMNA